MQYLGCNQINGQLEEKSQNENDSQSLIGFIAVFFVLIIMFVVFVLIIIFFLRKKKTKPILETKKDVELKATLRPIKLGEEVEDIKIGALSSKLNWNMKVSEISTAFGEPLDLKGVETSPSAKKMTNI